MIGELNAKGMQDAFGLNEQAMRHLGVVTRTHGIVSAMPIKRNGKLQYVYDQWRVRALFAIGRVLAKEGVLPYDFYTDDQIQRSIAEQVKGDKSIDPSIRELVHPPVPIREVRKAMRVARGGAVVYRAADDAPLPNKDKSERLAKAPRPSDESIEQAQALTRQTLQEIQHVIPNTDRLDGVSWRRVGLTPEVVQILAFIDAVSRGELPAFDLGDCDDMRNAELEFILGRLGGLLLICERDPNRRDIRNVWDLFNIAVKAAHAQARKQD